MPEWQCDFCTRVFSTFLHAYVHEVTDHPVRLEDTPGQALGAAVRIQRKWRAIRGKDLGDFVLI